ncbi:MAG TPA: hypothetical protein PKO06_06705 [Candidatus Ozemobacteraceae bacterium]|nr:hypothetical protein [Candidatus Ozemobacteraceae bacterium]
MKPMANCLVIVRVVVLLCCLLKALTPVWSQSLQMTPQLLFAEMERKAGGIDSLIAELELASGSLRATVQLAIQSPDKFSMDFQGRVIRVVFDGERLWIHINALNEVFLLDTSKGGSWLGDVLRDYVNPRRIITQVTRKTLFSFFDVSMLASPSIIPSFDEPLAEPATAGYCLRFTPILGDWARKIFDVGYYEMVFSRTTFLPYLVVEYSTQGKLRGSLRVFEYRMNEVLPKERFEFTVPEGVKVVPLAEVVMQKLEEAKDTLVDNTQKWMDGLQKQISDWGF